MVRKYIIILLQISLLVGWEAKSEVVFLKGGSIDCGKWLTARKENYATLYEGYLIGSIDGLQMGSIKKIWDNKGTVLSNEQLFYWTDNYCSKNPIKTMIDVVQEFSKEMNSKINE